MTKTLIYFSVLGVVIFGVSNWVSETSHVGNKNKSELKELAQMGFSSRPNKNENEGECPTGTEKCEELDLCCPTGEHCVVANGFPICSPRKCADGQTVCPTNAGMRGYECCDEPPGCDADGNVGSRYTQCAGNPCKNENEYRCFGGRDDTEGFCCPDGVHCVIENGKAVGCGNFCPENTTPCGPLLPPSSGFSCCPEGTTCTSATISGEGMTQHRYYCKGDLVCPDGTKKCEGGKGGTCCPTFAECETERGPDGVSSCAYPRSPEGIDFLDHTQR